MKRSVDPDADTVLPAGRREDAAMAGTGIAVVLESGGARLDAELVSVAGGVVVVVAARGLPVDTEVRATCGDLAADARVVWTRSQGPSVAVGLLFSPPSAADAWTALLG